MHSSAILPFFTAVSLLHIFFHTYFTLNLASYEYEKKQYFFLF